MGAFRGADWQPDPDRPDVVAMVRESDEERLPDLLGLRYGRMLASPFTFLRGSAAVMAADLGQLPQSGLRVQACGDAHIGNFRLLGTPERQLNFDINDFDETLPAPFEWDVLRLAASAVVAARLNKFSAKACRQIASAAARSYRIHMRDYAQGRPLDVWYSGIDSTVLEEVLANATIDAKQKQLARRRIRKARQKDNLRALRRLTTVVDGTLRFRDDPPRLQHNRADDELVHEAIRMYRGTLPPHIRVLFDRYTFVDDAMKVVGVGSVGTRCWAVLFDGGDQNSPLVLQVKQAGSSVLEPFAGRSKHRLHGQRVVEGQRLMQAAGDILLGWTRTRLGGIDYYVRQLWDMKGKLDTQMMTEESMALFAELCGWTLARSHARSGDPGAICDYLGTDKSFERSVRTFAVNYADQTERDHERLCAAAEKGDLPVTAE